MYSVIQVDFRAEWDYPVRVVPAGSREISISGPRQALKYLQMEFTLKSGQTYWNAVGSCESAIRRKGDIEMARQNFISAYAEYMVKLHS